MHEERLWLLVSLKLSGEATPDELAELNALLKKHPEAYFQLEVLEKLWKTKKEGIENTDAAYNRHFQRLTNYLAETPLQYDHPAEEQASHRYRYKKLFLITGIAALFIITFLFIWQFNRQDKKLMPAVAPNSITTKQGSKSKVQLPDGSQVWLNADSRITYDENLAGAYREVYLSGEAYFDVVKDEARPFIIHTKSVDIKVLGTAFNVRSYPNETTAETSLIRGSVEITVLNNGKKITLQPSEKLVVQKEVETNGELQPVLIEKEVPVLSVTKLHYLVDDSITVETSWVKNKLAFDGETLEQVALKIERWYDVNIHISDDKLKDVEYTGIFEEETLPEVMSALQLTGNFQYAINKKEVVIYP